jgi:hypothetical protein
MTGNKERKEKRRNDEVVERTGKKERDRGIIRRLKFFISFKTNFSVPFLFLR